MVEDWLTQYGALIGYLVILLGSFVEGESIVLTAGFLSYKGYFSLPGIIALSFLGSLFADQILFFFGWYRGPEFLKRRPWLQQRSRRVFELLDRYDTFFILSFRFIYGIRVASPIIIGASGISRKRFMILNFVAALIWAVLSCCAGYLGGYLFADRIDDFFAQFDVYQRYIFGGLAALVAILLFLYFKRKRRKKNKI